MKHSITPISTNNLPIPLALIELSAYGCKIGCKTNRCKCRKSGFTWTGMCECAQCENNDCWIEDADNVLEEEEADDDY